MILAGVMSLFLTHAACLHGLTTPHQEIKDQRPRIRGQNTELPFGDLYYSVQPVDRGEVYQSRSTPLLLDLHSISRIHLHISSLQIQTRCFWSHPSKSLACSRGTNHSLPCPRSLRSYPSSIGTGGASATERNVQHHAKCCSDGMTFSLESGSSTSMSNSQRSGGVSERPPLRK